MFRVLEGKLGIWLVFYGRIALKNHYGSSQRQFFRKSSTLVSVLTVRFLSFQACFQAVLLKHFEPREVKYDPSLYFSTSF
jgi:hypothetical protein